jgi:hypothetical protein
MLGETIFGIILDLFIEVVKLVIRGIKRLIKKHDQ